MEISGIDGSYLHKKFKKQVSIIERPPHDDRKTEETPAQKEAEDRKTTTMCNINEKTGTSSMNNECDEISVPKHSTNNSYCNNNLWNNTFKSSIIANNEPSSSSTISHHPPSSQSSIIDRNFYNKLDRQPPPTEDISDTDKTERQPGKYVCNYCNLVCSKPSVLQKHIRAHTNERPYPCNSCGFSFKTRSNLYKHCRSRTHANRVMGNSAKVPEHEIDAPPPNNDLKTITKPYKPRFHTSTTFQEDSPSLSEHINDIISKNNSIVNDNSHLFRKKSVTESIWENNNDYHRTTEEPLNLTSKNRKRCMSEVVEPQVQKSLIKELLLKNLNSDMQCPHCKMIFQTVTELELHKLRSCKGFVHPNYTRSSSVNVASILTQNKNAFDGIPYFQNTLNFKSSSASFLARARSEKSFSLDDNTPSFTSINFHQQHEKERPPPVKMFGGELKITSDRKAFKMDKDTNDKDSKMTENRVVKSSLQSGGTVLTNKTTFPKSDSEQTSDIIRVYPTASSDVNRLEIPENMEDFSQKAVKLMTPNLKKPNFAVPGVPVPNNRLVLNTCLETRTSPNMFNPVNLVVNGRVVRYVPGMPGPVTAEEPEGPLTPQKNEIILTQRNDILPLKKNDLLLTPVQRIEKVPTPESKSDTRVVYMTEKQKIEVPKTTPILVETKNKFSRPNSLALKPTTASMKQHHGLTPTMFNQILISPDTPRVAKKYVQQFLHGNYFSYLGLKSSTKPVYCTLNKTQPFYVPHFKKLSMYSEWRQQDTKTDKSYVSGYDSRQKMNKYTMAGSSKADLVVHSSYKFSTCESESKDTTNEEQKKALLGGYESNEDYTYIRGRGRGRYVCDQCGIRCKKPSMLKKHIRTHSNDRPYTCNDCNFSFKTKGNLTKHMKSKAHNKNTTPSASSGSSTQQSGTQSSESDTEDSGMDSSDECTRREEHEAAYGLLSLSQKNPNVFENHNDNSANIDLENPVFEEYLGKSSTTTYLTYPYTSARPKTAEEERTASEKTIQQFHVIQKYAPKDDIQSPVLKDLQAPVVKVNDNLQPPVLKVNDNPVVFEESRKRKMSDPPVAVITNNGVLKVHKNEEVMDLSMPQVRNEEIAPIPASPMNLNQKSPSSYQRVDYDNSAMETLADIATKQVKLEKNTLAKSVASEFLKIATKNDHGEGRSSLKEVNELIVKPEGSRSCHICGKSFHKTSQLRLHMNIHYLERPFRCHSCAVSFRTKGHLLKHERSAGHNNKLSSSPALALTEPRPFKCIDCNIAFRIHGHLAKHLRSKMHIMKLECLAKIPFGLYAELERSNSLLTEINTADGDQCLESLKNLAKKVFQNDPTKLNQLGNASMGMIDQQNIVDVDIS